MTTVTQLIEQLTRLKGYGHGDEEVIAVHGASGAYDQVGSVFPDEVEEGDEDLLELTAGTKFVSLYTGN